MKKSTVNLTNTEQTYVLNCGMYDRKNKTNKLQKSDDGEYYLPSGTYEVVLEVFSSETYKQELSIK